MTSAIDTLGKAARHNMIVRAECRSCGNARFYRASDLAMHFGGGRDVRSLKFRCQRCEPKVDVSVIEIDTDRLPRLTVSAPVAPDRGRGPSDWIPTRLK